MANINRLELLESLKKVVKIVPSSNTLEIITGLLVEMGDGLIKVSATNLITSIITKTECDTGMFPKESFVVEAKLFFDIISKISTDEVVITYSDRIINIKGGTSVFKIQSKGEIQDFPAIDRNISNKKSIILNSEILKELVNKTIKFASDDETRPSIGGVNLVFRENKVMGVSLDGYRLAHYVAEIENTNEVEFTIDSLALSNISKALNKESLSISYSDITKLIEFDLGDTSIYTSTLEGKFFNFEKLMQIETYSTKIIANNKSLKHAIERASILAKDNKATNPIVTQVEDNCLVITSSNLIGTVTEKVSIGSLEGDTPGYKIAFNPKYILDGINAIDSEEIEIRLNGGLNPAYLIDKENDFIYLMLPIRLAS